MPRKSGAFRDKRLQLLQENYINTHSPIHFIPSTQLHTPPSIVTFNYTLYCWTLELHFVYSCTTTLWYNSVQFKSVFMWNMKCNTDVWFCTVCKITFPMTFQEPLWVPSSVVISLTYDHWRWDPQWLPKRCWEIYLAHHAKSPKTSGHKLNLWPTAAPETSLGDLSRTLCKIPQSKDHYPFHGESLNSRWSVTNNACC